MTLKNIKLDTEKDCIKFLKEYREKHGLVCPKCGGTKHKWEEKYDKI